MKPTVYYHKRPVLKAPIFIAAWPGMGEVALKTVSYLKDKLNAEEFAYIEADDFFYPTGVLVKKSIIDTPTLPLGKFFSAKNKIGLSDIIIFISEAQPDLAKGRMYCENILKVAQDLKVKEIFCFAAMPVPIDYTQEPEVWASATSADSLAKLKPFNLKFLQEGQISGMNGLFLGMAKEKGFQGICLLGEIPLYTIQMENPKASIAILKVLSSLFKFNIDLQELQERSRFIEGEITKLIDYLRGQEIGEHFSTAISQEEIERIKNILSTYTKLPESARENIERLFKEAKEDLTTATELKKELDKWNVYKEFEDRFLDLFKKDKTSH